jgi:hypothetical protein
MASPAQVRTHLASPHKNQMPSQTVVVRVYGVRDGACWWVLRIFSGHTLHIEIIGDPTCLADKVVVLVQQGMALFNYTFQ